LKKLKEAKRYANTLLRNVGMENVPQALIELSAMNELMTRSKELKSLLVNPQFTLEEREKIFKQIAVRIKLSENIIKFIIHLSEIGLALYLSDIIRIAAQLYQEKKLKAKAIVMTPIEISKDYEASLKSSLKKAINKDVDIEYVMDPSLLGGVLVKIGSTMYDTSIKSQLRLLKDELIKR
jgi:ATP synthase F1 delta subunit